MKRHTPTLDSTSISQGYTYLHIPMNALCPIALNVDFWVLCYNYYCFKIKPV